MGQLLAKNGGFGQNRGILERDGSKLFSQNPSEWKDEPAAMQQLFWCEHGETRVLTNIHVTLTVGYEGVDATSMQLAWDEVVSCGRCTSNRLSSAWAAILMMLSCFQYFSSL